MGERNGGSRNQIGCFLKEGKGMKYSLNTCVGWIHANLDATLTADGVGGYLRRSANAFHRQISSL